METGTDIANTAATLELVERAFAHRRPPSVLSDSQQLTEGEYAEVMAFRGLRWQDVTHALVQQCPDAVFWFSPEAFCYYLPGFFASGLRENRADLMAYDALLHTLDRSPEPEYWDDFFLPRWTRLSVPEVDAVAAWAKWVECLEPDEVYGNLYERVQTTLDLLRDAAKDEGSPRIGGP